MPGELNLTRNYGGTIVLETSDGPVYVTVRRITGETVRLGIAAPKAINIYRGELRRPDGKRYDAEIHGT